MVMGSLSLNFRTSFSASILLFPYVVIGWYDVDSLTGVVPLPGPTAASELT